MPTLVHYHLDRYPLPHDATTSWSMFFHPLGEMNVADFLTEQLGDRQEQRFRFVGIELIICLTVVGLYVFARNLVKSLSMTVTSSDMFIPWCCLLSSFLGVATSIVALITLLGAAFNCRILIWTVGFSWSLSVTCNSLILLRKAYLILCRKRWIIYVSVPLMIPQLCYLPLTMHLTFVTLEREIGCANYYSVGFRWYWATTNALVNIFFSGIFCNIALKQYRMFKSEAWKRMARDGIQTMGLATLSNVVSCILPHIHLEYVNFDMLLVLDW
ncbi:hypothetical protein SYNPS1DRAFT_29414 [Syncephalis pseudoplumigaleata]|uniref:G-protein coupled receptors family 1 profile domain-containing protein n=1 Tax=Syncephalis pseudoplumigaleata TaxID=1712513 RepID=A0A4V1J1F1_9FUNG|nr:hypothetical protein SYNPS1DRAFT_29414 [Syncephalis pseudoplumigaleata]|eukprot:RKP24839.1 hypothetical protein SYNPS1DRAFT_29414 [Syncephalis pseudoplumigaleata]